MPGYVSCIAPCAACRQPFSFNPLRVPSIRIDGIRRPICLSCIGTINRAREQRGLEPFSVMSDAYEPLPEEQLPFDDV